MISFREKVYAATRKIPKGRVSTYKTIARMIGSPRAARAVGNALNTNPDTSRTPCHRVVRSTGKIGGYALGTRRKAEVLKKEGVTISSGRVDLEKFGFPRHRAK